MPHVNVIGAGLAGTEAALKLADNDIKVTLFEMKPKKFSDAHESENFAELVCSNSLRSNEETAAVGLLKLEMSQLNSVIIEAANLKRVPAGKALAVNRSEFSEFITKKVKSHPNITVVNEEVLDLNFDDLTIVAAGPLCSAPLTETILSLIDADSLYFYDSIAPIITTESIDMSKAFWANRWDDENVSDGDYLNIPMNKEEYLSLVDELLKGEKVETRNFEKTIHFEGCLPVEEIARRGEMTLAFGPMKPVGLINPHSTNKSFANIQLRKENLSGSAVNMVGFQTKLTYGEQKRIFRQIPGFEKSEFQRLGSMHRNTYINAPKVLTQFGELKNNQKILFTGQITGVEGYVESAASGLMTGIIVSHLLKHNSHMNLPPATTAMGALFAKLHSPEGKYTPSNITFSMFDDLNLNKKVKKKERKILYSNRAKKDISSWINSIST